MKRLSALLAAGAVAAALAVPAGAQTISIAGEWTLTRQAGPGGGAGGRGGQRPATKMVIQQEGNTFTGTLTMPFGEAPIQEGAINGNEISFKVSIETPRGTFEMTYTGKVEGDTMSGTVSGRGGRGGGEWTAKKVET
jgi:hypothetical protein